MYPQHTLFNSTIFTTKNNELAIFGRTLDDIEDKIIKFSDVYEQYGLFGKKGAIASLFDNNKSNNIITPETLKQFDEFKEKFNSSSLSAEALAEQMENVDQRIIDYAKTCKNGEMTTEGFKASIDTMSFSAKAGKVALQALAMAGNMLAMWAISKVISIAAQKLDDLAHAAENAKEKAKTSKQELDSLTSEISDLNKELETAKDRIEELLEKANSGTISLLEEEELNNLREQNDELQREIALKEKLAEIDAKEAADNAAYSLTYRTDDNKWDDEYNATDRIDKLQKYVDSANFYQDKLSEINQKIVDIEKSATDNSYKDDSVYKDLIKHQEEYQNGLKKVEEQMSSIYKELSVEDDGLYYNGEVIEGYEDLAERLDTVYMAVELYLDEENVESTTEEYIDKIKSKLIDSGLSDEISSAVSEGFSEEELNSIMNSDSIDWSQCLGLDNATAVIDNIREQLASITVDEITVSTFDQAWADSFTSEDEAVRELGNTLLGLAEKGRLTKETFKEADSTAGDYFKNLGISADEALAKINKLVDESSQLSSMSSQISSMAEALGTKQENGFVEADTLSGFDVEVRGLDSWDRFQEVLGSTASSYEECQEAANALATEWVNSSDFLAQLTEQNEEYYKTQLESMGIENYEEVISYAHALNEAKEVLSQSSLMLGNATYDEIEALIAEGQYSELTANMILALYDAKIAEQAAALDTSADCANLIALAGDADRTSQSIQLLIQLMEIYSGLESGVYDNNEFARTGALAAVTGIKAQLEAIANGETAKMEIEPTVKLGNRGKSSAKSAGKEAGKSYKDGLKEELSDIESIISSLSKSIDGQKEVITSQKEVALESIESQIDALEEERDARLAVIDAQKKQLEEQIKAIEKQIKAKNDEIKAINDAATARQHEIDLQKAQYELERMQNQRTMLQYSEEKGMHYVADESGIRDAREDVDDAKRQLKIDAIEREIDLLENKKDLLNEQIDLLDEQADNINKYYDSQIKLLEKQKESTEKYFESLIKSIENSKSKYEELLELVDKAELSGKLKQLGIDEEALLNGSEEEFEKLKNAYLDVVFQVNEGNEEMLSSLRELSGYEGTAPAVLTDTSEKLDDMNTKLDGSTESMDKLSSSATTASEGASSIAASMGELGTNTEGISDNLTNINDALNGLPETDKLADLAATFTSLGEAIQAVADVLGIGEEGAVSTLVSALNEISTLSLDGGGDGGEEGAGGGIISQFNNLKTAVDDVTNAISGGGSSGSTGGGDASNSSSPSMSAGAGDGEGASGLISAIGEIKPATDEALGGGGEEGESEGEGSGAIPQFQELKTAVDDVTAVIGTADSEGGEGTGEGAESTTLIGALRAQYETASETIPETKALFEELLESIMSCVSALNTMVGMMGSMAEIGGGFGGSAISVTPNAKGTVGNAFANGTGKYKGLANREKNALVSEYGQTEMTVLPNGKTIITDKPTMMDLPKDTVIFNEEQTKKIMDSKVDASGNAYASGTDNGSVPYQPTGELAALMDFCKQNVKSILKSEQEIALTVHEMQKQINNGIMSGINSVTNTAINNISNNNKPSVVIGDINVTCPGVTSQQVAEQLGGVLGKELDKQFNGFNNYVDQQSRIR